MAKCNFTILLLSYKYNITDTHTYNYTQFNNRYITLLWTMIKYYIAFDTTGFVLILIFSWRRLLSYNISAIFLKVFLHLLGCTIFNYLQWHSCVLMQTLCIFCSPGVVNNQGKLYLFRFYNWSVVNIFIKLETCGITKSEIGFSWDVLTFILLMFQRRFFESRHFSRLAENAKITAVLASKMYITVQEWGRKRKDENRLLDSKSIMKIKEKVNKLRKNKERITKKKETHFTGTKSVFIIIHLLSTLHLYT